MNNQIQNWSQYKPKSFPMKGQWIDNWFSNMTPCELVIDGIIYNSVENYYQAKKSSNLSDWLRISKLTPSQSKREGRKLKLRFDWEDVKYSVMMKALKIKFALHPQQRKLLLDTGDDIIIEWNNWNDKEWGVTIHDCEGKNLLGQALMEIRESFKK